MLFNAKDLFLMERKEQINLTELLHMVVLSKKKKIPLFSGEIISMKALQTFLVIRTYIPSLMVCFFPVLCLRKPKEFDVGYDHY